MKNKFRIIISMFSIIILMLAYNNCGVGFESTGDFQYDDGLTSTSTPTPGHATPAITNGSSFTTAKKLGANKSSAFRMLTGFEVQNSLEDIFSIDLTEVSDNNLLPGFSDKMFSNFQEDINISSVHVSGIATVANLVDDKLTEQKLKDIVPCIKDTADATCKKQIIDKLTLSLFRKKIDAELSSKYVAFLNSHDGEVVYGTRLLIQALIQSPSFLSRQEVGIKNGNSYSLNNYEIASRISYFITGSTPDEELLTLAASKELTDPEVRSKQALRLFNSSRGKNNIFRINKEIFRISKLGIEKDLGQLFTNESEMLFNDIIYEKDLPWSQVFTSQGSFMNRSLASHYGLSAPDQNFSWTSYTGDRQGILSHGSFLSYQYTGDPEITSPIKRGLQIVEDLLCKHLPPPSDVDIDNDPAARLENECKIVARKKTTLNPQSSCFACHTFMEPLGLSLERFNMLGQYRTHEKDKKECTTIEPGSIDGEIFNSMPKLGSLMADHKDINLCLTKRVLSFAFGNFITNDNVMAYNTDLNQFNSRKTFKNLVIGIVSSPQFTRRDL